MLGLHLLTLITATTVAVLALPSNLTAVHQQACGTYLPSDAITTAEAHFSANKVSFKESKSGSTSSIPVYWHVIQSGNKRDQGKIPKSQIKNTIALLNKDYAQAGLTFKLAGYDRTINPFWFNTIQHGGPAEVAMKNKLRKGDAKALNVYTVGKILNDQGKSGTVGYATFPSSYSRAPKDDGVVMLWNTAPGTQLGKALTHEAGHWAGDHVDDTPPEASPSYDCSKPRDTCSGGGVDPIHNM
ncbi:hypothetical protein FRC12_015536 [Ceratobasidium sp. 428]|nr:hypothetical protein FRC12_015536 [Ceratobasidium sp. 428]